MNASQRTGARSRRRHGIVYRNDREFCGWPFICGFWTTAEATSLVAFQKKACAYTDPGDVHHDEVAKVGPKIVYATVARPRRDLGRSEASRCCSTFRPTRSRCSRAGRTTTPASRGSTSPTRTCSSPPARRPTTSARTAAPGSACPATAGGRGGADRGAEGRTAVAVGPRVGDGAARRRQPGVHDRGQRRRLEATTGRLRERGRRRWLDVPVRDDAGRRRRRRRQRPQRRPALRRAPLLLSARHRAARRPHPRVGPLSARPDQRPVDRDLRRATMAVAPGRSCRA